MLKKHTNIIGLSIMSCAIGIIIGLFFSQVYTSSTDEAIQGVRQSGYTYINPLLECETSTYGNNQKYIPFEKAIIKKINTLQEQHPDVFLSVYFRNLRNGPWFGINEDADFSPASLMKLPLLIMYLKGAEKDPTILQKTITINTKSDLNQIYAPNSPLTQGATYTVAELLFHLIVYSDNTASNTLINSLPQDLQDQVFTDLSIPLPKTMDYSLSVKEYSSFFRMLYNASYLSREHSEMALNLLSQSTFTGGLVGKLPKDLVIAHKFGEREMLDEKGGIINQLHDCGIIYYETYPYLTCIMTRGPSSMENLSSIIQDSSKIIYDEVSKAYPTTK